MTRLSPAKSVTSTAYQDDYIGSLPAFREQMVDMRRILSIPFFNNGIARNPTGQRAMEVTENV